MSGDSEGRDGKRTGRRNGPRDPVERAARNEVDLYDVSTWEPRSRTDRVAVGVYAAIAHGLRAIVLLATLVITLSILAGPAVLVADAPLVSAFFLASVVPAGLLAAYIWYTDVTANEPLGLVVGTFVLAVLFATVAAVANQAGQGAIETLFGPATIVGTLLFFYLVVGPVEEVVKLLAVRVLAFRSRSFDAVVDGAVYGAVAGLGFATIENVIYIATYLGEAGPDGGTGLFVAATEIATTRALAGPGHVIYSAIAGYYLGLAKFNPGQAGPLVVKGLLVAAVAHGTYNVAVQGVPGLIALNTPLGPDLAFVAFVIGYNGLVGYYLYRKIDRYRRTYRHVRDDVGDDHEPELTEFEPPTGR